MDSNTYFLQSTHKVYKKKPILIMRKEWFWNFIMRSILGTIAMFFINSWLETAGITDDTTRPMAVDALKWAAYTYVISAIGSLITLLYYIGIARRD